MSSYNRAVHDVDRREGGDPRPTATADPEFELREAWIAGPAGNLFVWEGGDLADARGELPVVLVHGLAGSLRQWRHQLSSLWPHRRAVAFDLRGHGRSDRPRDGDYGIAAHAADLAAVLDAYRLPRAVLVGHSMGAAVVVEYAAANPGRVAGLFLVDPNADSSALDAGDVARLVDSVRLDPEGEFRFHYRQFLVGARPATAEMVLEDLGDTPGEALAGCLAASMTHPTAATLARYEGPARAVISAFNDLPYSLPRLLPELPTAALPRASHWLMLDRPDDVDRLLDDFLARVGS